MKKKVIIIIVIIILVLLILLIPRPIRLKDGGTVVYKALLYKVSIVHSLNPSSLTGYEDGVIIEILGFKIYENIDKHMDYLDS